MGSAWAQKSRTELFVPSLSSISIEMGTEILWAEEEDNQPAKASFFDHHHYT
jgi:hypothetical protein